MEPLGSTFGLTSDWRYGRAFEQLVNLADFAGNVTRSYGIGGLYVERIRSVSFQLKAVGGAGTRFGLVQFLDQGGVVFSASGMPFTVAAGFTSELVFDVGANPAGAANTATQITSLPDHFLQPTYSVVLSVVGGLAADTVSKIRVMTAKFSTSPRDFPGGQGPELSPELEDAALESVVFGQ